MATRYWVGGSGNWSDATNHWSDSSGGTPAAAYLPSIADDVVFDGNSNTGTDPFTVTVDFSATCKDFTASGLDGLMTVGSSSTNVALSVYGSMSLPATNLAWSPASGITLAFRGTSSNTITTNGVTLNTTTLNLDAVGGTLTLGSALTLNSTRALGIINGTFSTSASNYTLTAGALSSSNSNIRTIDLNGSAVSLTSATALDLATSTNLTFTAGTSTITCTPVTTTFSGGGQTFNNVSFIGGAGTKTINGANTFNGTFTVTNAANTIVTFGANQTFTGGATLSGTAQTINGGGFTFTGTFTLADTTGGTHTINGTNTWDNLTVNAPTAAGTRVVALAANQTITGTLTTNGTRGDYRTNFVSTVVGTQRTLTVNAISVLYTGFQDIIAAGASSPWSFPLGIWDLGNNTNITFDISPRFWVGGTGNWYDGTMWSASSGGAAGAATDIPGPTNTVWFDAASNVGVNPFTVTVTIGACQDFNTGGPGGALDGAMTLSMGATATLDCYGSMTLPPVNFTWSGVSGATIAFRATTVGKTVTTNGVTLTNMAVTFNGVGGEWTLGSAFTNTTGSTNILAGSLVTNNFNITTPNLASTSTSVRSLTLGSSTITFNGTTPINFTNTTNFTFNAGTSTITCSNASPTFTGGGLTFYNVTFSSTAAGTVTMTGANTFNNLTQSTIAAVGYKYFLLGASITVNGTLTLNNGTLGGARVVFRSSALGTARTVTAATLATTADVDFLYITAAGASIPWSGTRLGDCGGNTNITFAAGVNKYWNLAAGGNWTSTAWALSSGGAVAAINYPLPQDTAIIENTGLNTGATITINVSVYMGSLDCSGRTNAFNWTMGNSDPQIFGPTFKLSSAMTMTTVTGSPSFNFSGSNITQTFDSAGIQVRVSQLNINIIGGTLLLAGNTTVDLTNGSGAVNHNNGTLDLAGYTLTAVAYSSSDTSTRSIAFGTSKIVLTGGNNVTIFNTATATNFTVTGTPVVDCTYSGSTGTRTITVGNAGESNAITFNITAGTDIVSIGTTSSAIKNLNFIGFFGRFTTSNTLRIFGNLTLQTGMTADRTSSGQLVFFSTSGVQTITSNTVILDMPVTVDNGASVQVIDALNMATQAITLTRGTFNANNQNVYAGFFGSSNSNTRTLTMGSGTWTLSGTGTPWDITTSTNMTLNANTSNLFFTGSNGVVTFQGGSLTYYNVTAQDSLYRFVIGGGNTYNNLTLSNTSFGEQTVQFPSSLTQTITGTFYTIGNYSSTRVIAFASTLGTAANISAAAVSLSNANFRDITAAGAVIPWTGTSLGDCGGNTNILFTAPKTVYWSLPIGGDWSSTAWATSSGGIPNAANQPLPQDTAIFDNAGINAGSPVLFTSAVQTGAWDCSALTNAVTFNFIQNYGSPTFYGNVTFGSGVTTTSLSTSGPALSKRGGIQVITSAGRTWGVSVNFSGTRVQLADNLTTSQNATLNYGELDLNNNALTALVFSSSNATIRSIAFGTGYIDVTGNNATIWNCSDLTNFSYTGTPTVNFTYGGSTGTRFVNHGTTGGNETNAFDFNITAGSDTWGPQNSNNIVRNLDYTGFSGIGGLYSTGFIYGNLTLSPTQTISASSGVTTFAATSGIKTITTNGVLLDRNLTFNGIGGTWALQDALTLGSGYVLSLLAGTLTTNSYSVSCARFFGSTGATGDRTLNLGASSFTCAGFTGGIAGWVVTDSGYNFTVNAGTSTIYLAEVYTGASRQDFQGGGRTYYNLVYTQGQPSIITGNNTFNSISNTFQPITISFEAGSTQTVTNFGLSGTSGNLVTLDSSAPGSKWYLVTSALIQTVQNCSIQDSDASPANTWFSRIVDGNVDAGNNTGWVFAGSNYLLSVQETSTVTDSNSVSDYWTPIPDTQAANWQQVNDTQSAGWQQISDTQNPNWTIIQT